MEDREEIEKTAETLKNEAIEHRQSKIKQKINQIIMSKRLLAHKEDQNKQKSKKADTFFWYILKIGTIKIFYGTNKLFFGTLLYQKKIKNKKQ